MRNFGTFLLWALAACTLCHGSLTDQIHGIESKLDSNLRRVQSNLEAKLNTSLVAVQTRLENQLQAIENQLQAVSNKIDAAKLEIPDLVRNNIPFGFERIGNRYFRIVNKLENWSDAERKCREMQGYLASFRDDDEIAAISEKLDERRGYWLGSNDQVDEGNFISVATQRPALIMMWSKGNPDDETHRENCVILQKGRMSDENCNDYFRFICQADNKS